MLNLEHKLTVDDLLDAKYDKDFFISRGMIDNYCVKIDNLTKENGWDL